MVTNLQMVAHFLNLFSNKHNLMQFLANLWAATANSKGVGDLQTFGQSQNKSTFQHNSSISYLKCHI